MFSTSDLQLIQEACRQRARQWHDQALRMNQPELRAAYRGTAAKFEALAQRVALRSGEGMEIDAPRMHTEEVCESAV